MTTRNRNSLTNHILVDFILLNGIILFVLFLIFPALLEVQIREPQILGTLLISNSSWFLLLVYTGAIDIQKSYQLMKKSKNFFINIILLVAITYTFGNVMGVAYFDQPIILLPIFSFATLNLLFVQSFFNTLKTKERTQHKR